MRAAGFSDRAPEVVIRVVSAGSNNLPAIRWHLRDISYGKNRECIRLNIRKPMLHSWRQLFAHHLRAQGVAAKATRRAGRSAVRRPTKVPGMLRPVRKLDSPRTPQNRAA